MTSRRIDAGPLLVLAGTLLLLVGLFLPWYEPQLEAWDIFEVVDLLLAGLGVAALLTALGMLADFPAAPDARLLPWLSGVPFVLVAASLLDRPPIVGDGDPDIGAWLSLAGTALMAAGTLLALARVSVAFDVQGRDRRQRVAAVDARTAAPGAAVPDAAPAPPARQAPPPTADAEPTSPTEPIAPVKDRPPS